MSCASTLLMLHMSNCLLHLLGCSISHTCCRSSFVLLLCCAESLLLHHLSPSFIDVCLVLFCSAPSSLLLLLLHPVWAACTWGLLFFFSCACPSPSRSEHRRTHSDPSGGETTEDQPPAQAGGGQRYGSGPDRMGLCLGKGCVVFIGNSKISVVDHLHMHRK